MIRWEKFLCAIGLHQWCYTCTICSNWRECNKCGKKGIS